MAGIFSRAINFKAQHAAATSHLFHRQGALRMTFKEWIMHSFDLGMSTEKFRHSQRVFILPLDAHRHRLSSAQQQKRGVRIHAASPHGPASVTVLKHVTPSRNDAAD